MTIDDGPGAAYVVARSVLRPAMRMASRHDWKGQEHLPPSGGCIVVSNHLSHADPISIADFIDAAGRRPRFLGKAELFDRPVLGRLLHSAGQIPVQRESEHARAALAAAVEAVRRGECVVIYPEGTLTRDPNLWPMVAKTGAARIWWLTGCPVVPVAQWGPHELLAPHGGAMRVPRIWRRPLMQVRAGPPLRLQRADPPDYVALTASIMASISELLGTLRQQAAPSSPFDLRASGGSLRGTPRDNRDGLPTPDGSSASEGRS